MQLLGHRQDVIQLCAESCNLGIPHKVCQLDIPPCKTQADKMLQAGHDAGSEQCSYIGLTGNCINWTVDAQEVAALVDDLEVGSFISH